MQFNWYLFDQMEASMAISMLALRHRVFGEEQLFLGQEVDEWDKTCQHLCVIDHREVVACLRLCPLKSRSGYDSYEIARLCVDPFYRGRKVAKKMMGMAVVKAMGNGFDAIIETHAPVYLMEFYRSVGFEAAGDPYMEDNIPHARMKLSQPSILEDPILETKKATDWPPS